MRVKSGLLGALAIAAGPVAFWPARASAAPITLNYTGFLQSFTLNAGTYTFTVAGAQGGNHTTDSVAGGLGADLTGT